MRSAKLVKLCTSLYRTCDGREPTMHIISVGILIISVTLFSRNDVLANKNLEEEEEELSR